jgi:polysaccharide biosynthesis/export protein
MAKNRFSLSCAILCACLMPGLVARGQASQPEAGTQPLEATPQSEAIQAPKLAIGPGDILDVEVFDTPDLSMAAARVSQTGQVTLPVVGMINVVGLNPEQAARQIESTIRARGVMLEPHVTVSVVEYTTQGATLLGEVRAPGVYPTFGGRRLMDMIALAGGVAPSAGKLVTIAHRDNPQHPVIITLVPNALSLGSQENPIILPGDTIMVGKASVIYILGAVNRPGGFLIDNNERLSLLQALTMAGGWDRAAALSKARLIRKVPEGHKELMLDLKHVLVGKQADIALKDGDILFLPESLGKQFAYRGVDIVVAAAQNAAVYGDVY